MSLTPDKVTKIKQLLPTMSDEDKRRALAMLKTWEGEKVQVVGRDSLLDFADHVYPGYKVGPHHRRLVLCQATTGSPVRSHDRGRWHARQIGRAHV